MSQLVQVQSGRTQVRLPDRMSHESLEKVLLTDAQFDGLATAPFTSDLTDLGPGLLTAVVSLSTVTESGKAVVTWKPGFRGIVRSFMAIVTTAVSTGSRLGTFSLVIDQTQGATEVNVVTITGAPSGGNFTVTANGQTTGNVLFNATGATLQTAIEGLSNVLVGDVTVTGSAGGPYTITWGGNLAGIDMVMSSSGAGLTGGTTPAAVLTTTTAGVTDTDALTPLSGGVLALTSANCTPVGKALGGTNVIHTAAAPASFGLNSAIVIASSVLTAFAEGVVTFIVVVEPLPAK